MVLRQRRLSVELQVPSSEEDGSDEGFKRPKKQPVYGKSGSEVLTAGLYHVSGTGPG